MTPVWIALVDVAGSSEFMELVRSALSAALEALPPAALLGLITFSRQAWSYFSPVHVCQPSQTCIMDMEFGRLKLESSSYQLATQTHMLARRCVLQSRYLGHELICKGPASSFCRLHMSSWPLRRLCKTHLQPTYRFV